MDTAARTENYLYELLGHLDYGHLKITNHRGDIHEFGSPGGKPSASVVITDSRLYQKIFSSASLGVGETYMDGWWDETNDDIFNLMGILLRGGIYAKVRKDYKLIIKILINSLLTSSSTIRNRLKNISYHYDMGNEFYRLFLDPSLTYSCGLKVFDNDTMLLMQLQKYDLICKKLSLKQDENVLDIGCGWGGLLIYAAIRYGIKGTGITLSSEQANLARQRIAALGLSNKITIDIKDYKEVSTTYDKVVSVGMFEHVGKSNFLTFMKKINSLLPNNGVALLHTIGTTGVVRNDPWLARYIFPGGYLPRLEEVVNSFRQAKLTVADVENMRPHYAETLKGWLHTFRVNKQEIQSLSPAYNERFIRMWNYYLQSCQAGFTFANLQLYQILVFKGKSWPCEQVLHFDLNEISRNAKDSSSIFLDLP